MTSINIGGLGNLNVDDSILAPIKQQVQAGTLTPQKALTDLYQTISTEYYGPTGNPNTAVLDKYGLTPQSFGYFGQQAGDISRDPSAMNAFTAYLTNTADPNKPTAPGSAGGTYYTPGTQLYNQDGTTRVADATSRYGGEWGTSYVAPRSTSGTTSTPQPTMIEIAPGQYVNPANISSSALAQARAYNPNQAGFANLPQAQAPTTASNINQVSSYSGSTVSPYYGNVGGASASAAGMNSSLDAQSQYFKDLQAKDTAAQASLQEQTKGIFDFLKSKPSTEQLRQSAMSQTGINPQQYFAEEKAKITEIEQLTNEYNNVKMQKDAQIAATNDKLASNNFINNQIAQINRNSAPVLNQLSANINSKAAVLQALQGRFEEAQNFARQAVDDATADYKFKMDSLFSMYDMNKSLVDGIHSDYKDALQLAMTASENEYKYQRQEKEAIGDLLLRFPNAGIDIYRDSIEQAQQKAAAVGGDLAYYETQQALQDQYSASPKSSSNSYSPSSPSSPNTLPKFTSTQLNAGANRAGLTSEAFSKLAPDVQNFYVSMTSPQLTELRGFFSEVQSGGLSSTEAKSEVDSLQTTPAVKTYLKSSIDSLAPAPTEKKKGVIQNTWDNIWNSVTGFLGF